MNSTTMPTTATIENPHQVEDHPFDLDAEILCLNFVNTLRGRVDLEQREGLNEYADLVAFARVSGALDNETAQRLLDRAAVKADRGADAIQNARVLREALFRVFSAIAAGSTATSKDLHTFNETLSVAMAHSRIVSVDDGFDWIVVGEESLELPAWLIARSAANTLLGDERGRIRECAADDCAWIFVDTSRNRSRRWCSMDTCGNRAKVHHFRERRRADVP